MHVKVEPNEQLDLPVDLITDIESDLFREQLFGNFAVSNSDISESSSDDDHLSKFSFGYEPFPESFGTQLPSMWEPTSSRSSSTSGSFDQTFAELENTSNSFPEFNNEELDIAYATCSPHDVIMRPSEMKEEASLPSDFNSDSPISRGDSPNHIWDLLCSNDIKPNIKTLETPPVTPPGSNPILEDSPPLSPTEVILKGSPCSSPALLPSTAVITLTPLNSKPPSSTTPPQKKIALAPKIPFKIVTTITANENNGKCVTPRTIKIQPKTSSLRKPIISVTNSSVTKFSVTKAGSERNIIKLESKHLVQKPLVISSSQPSQHSTPLPTAASIPTTANVSTCTVIKEQKPPRLPPLAPALNPALKHNSLAELRALKRQQRMIKNRESASLSRKRKKEYLQGLEDKVRELDLENAKLRAENERLLRRVTALENERVIMRAARFPVKRSSTALLGFAFLLLFNTSSLTNLFKGGDTNAFPEEPWIAGDSFEPQEGSWDSGSRFHRRSLLSLSPLESLVGSEKEETSSSGNLSHVCPVSFNTTESIRIENELRDWFDSSSKDWPSKSKEEPLKKHANFHPKTKAGRQNGILDRRREKGEERRALAAPLTSAFPSATYQYLYQSEENTHGSFPNRRGRGRAPSRGIMSMGVSIQSLLESINRRNDTYYVVSLTADHLLLPATAHNTSARPKMSLLVPTPKGLDDHDLMQIDCEVTHTRLVRWTQHPEVSVPSVPSAGTFPEVPINATDSKESFRKEKTPLKKRKRKKIA